MKKSQIADEKADRKWNVAKSSQRIHWRLMRCPCLPKSQAKPGQDLHLLSNRHL